MWAGLRPAACPRARASCSPKGSWCRRCGSRRRWSGCCSPTCARRMCGAATSRRNGRRWRAALGALAGTGLTATDYLEGDGVSDADIAITVRVDVKDGVLHADFTGTAAAAPGNVNCPLAVTRSAVLFVVRTLLPDDVPMNAGVQRAVRVSAPPGCLVNARWPSAVAAGNVGTSQRIADVGVLALARGA